MFQPGDQVHLRSDPSRIGMVSGLAIQHAGEQYYDVFWGGPHGTTRVAERDLAPHASLAGPYSCLAQHVLGGYDAFQRFITLQRLRRDEPLRNNVYAFNASRTRFYPYQFKPLLKFLDSPRNRLLIADEVGLGKTIEAGLILTELRARHGLRLAMVVCPSNLRDKWRLELRHRFGEDFRAYGASELLAAIDEYEERPDHLALQAIVSFETIRQPRVASRLTEVAMPFDLVIVDEAHHLRNSGTSQRAAVVGATQAANAMILLTATPIQLGTENLHSLLNILDDEEFKSEDVTAARIAANGFIVTAERALAAIPPDWGTAARALREAASTHWLQGDRTVAALAERVSAVSEGGAPLPDRRGLIELRSDVTRTNLLAHVFTRTRKRQVQDHVATRHAQSVTVPFSAAERGFYDLVTKFIERRSLAKGHGPLISAWVLNTPQRRLTSCLAGMVEYYRDQGLPETDDSATDEPDAGIESDEGIGDGDIATVAELRRDLQQLVNEWPADMPDSKYTELCRVLSALASQRVGQKVILFASFRHTLAYLQRRLAADGYDCVTISGAVPAKERSALVSRFRDDPTVSLMLCSRVGAEGLDFQFCDTIMNYDLPWNPMEVEQRIGRIDRIGQQSEVLRIVNFWIEDSIEDRILRRLYDRIGVFERSIGELEPILGDLAREIQKALLDQSLSADEALLQAEELANAVETRRQASEELERRMAHLIGADQYFSEEVEAIRTRRRYVTGEQLRRFLVGFLRQHAPHSILDYDDSSNVGHLTVDKRLAEIMRKSSLVHECTALLGSLDGEPVSITFDAETAFAKPRVEFINVLHPLVQIAAAHEADENSCSAFNIAGRSNDLAPGIYPIAVYRVRVSAARSYSTLEAVVLAPDLSAEACDSLLAEQLLGQLVERGESAEAIPDYDEHVVDSVRSGMERAIVARIEGFRASERTVNDAFVDQRKRSIQLGAEKRLAQLRTQIAAERAGNQRARYLRLLEGQVQRAEGQLERSLRGLEAARQLSVEHSPIAVVLVHLSP